MRYPYCFFFALFLSVCASGHTSEKLLEGRDTILVLGDSITQRGDYVSYLDAWLVERFPERRFTVINAGLASETVSGLSEPGHAKGKFPRPCLFERLERVLAKTQPDLIIATYGMNCGIYLELDGERFARYRDGIRRLRAAARQYGAEVVHVTPPIYDQQGKPGFDYDTVLTAYADWLVGQREMGWQVVDLHSAMRARVDARRATDPDFAVQKDGVHPDEAGHWMMAQSLIAYFGDPEAAALPGPEALIGADRLAAIDERMRAYLKAIHAETKPLRPRVPMGGDLSSAAETAARLADRIYTAPAKVGSRANCVSRPKRVSATPSFRKGARFSRTREGQSAPTNGRTRPRTVAPAKA
jgi:lysophospholipase L1-like esterase